MVNQRGGRKFRDVFSLGGATFFLAYFLRGAIFFFAKVTLHVF